MKRKIPLGWIIAGLVGASVGLLSILNFTNPSEAGSFGVLGLFGFMYLLTLSLLLILQRLYDVIRHKKRDNDDDENHKRTPYLRINLIIVALSFMPIFVISMNSIGQLNVVDVALMVVIESIMIFYIVRRTTN
ncbi:hypothetical protein FWF74_01970 [Candidatus Saccharibacteria bacterium]|nr:hypothetical protein [Candidatus Saccharibacteria bacterium]MCL1963426.1 hypothetical protein [Candidatus Saccharibacteria bacterium]